MARIFVAGHRGMVGSALVRALEARGGDEIVMRTRQEVDLLSQAAVADFFAREKIDQVYVAAARVGGIQANNSLPAEFIYENLTIQTNLIHQAFKGGVRKLLFLGSSCIYPRLSPQPMREDALLTGTLEATNEPYAIAKIAGIKMCESYNRQYGASHGVDYRSVMPTNLYGPGDNYHPEHSHVVAAMIRRFCDAVDQKAPQVMIWGTGTPRREFMHVDDVADASIFVMNLDKAVYDRETQPMLSHINIGVGDDITIADLARTIAEIAGYRGEIAYDASKPDGTPRKLMECSRLTALGWKARISFRDGLVSTLEDFRRRRAEARN